jgi:hypothetical protein
MFEFRVRRGHRNATPEYAIRRAREVAFADGIAVFGDPVVTSRRVPIPLLGPRHEFVVTFPRATRRDRSAISSPPPLPLDEEGNLPHLHRIVDEVDEVG